MHKIEIKLFKICENRMKLEIKTKMQNRIFSNNCKLNNTLLNDQSSIRNQGWNLKKLTQVNENINTTYQSLWENMEAVLRGEYTAFSSFI